MEIRKNPGADWYIYYIDVADGEQDVMTVFGFPTAEAAAAEAREDLNDGRVGAERDWFEMGITYMTPLAPKPVTICDYAAIAYTQN